MKDVIILEHIYPCRSYCLKRLDREDLLTLEWLENEFPKLLQKYRDNIVLKRGDILVWKSRESESCFAPVRIQNNRVLFEKIAYDYHCGVYEGDGLVSDVILDNALPLIIRERNLERLSRPDYYLRLKSE